MKALDLDLVAAPYSSVVGIPIMQDGKFSEGLVASVMPRVKREEAEEIANLFVAAPALAKFIEKLWEKESLKSSALHAEARALLVLAGVL